MTDPQLTATIAAMRQRHSHADSDGDILLWRAIAMLTSYHHYYRDNTTVVPVAVERSYMHWVALPGGEKSIRAGKIDGVVEINGDYYVLEHKTTTSDISGPSPLYFASLQIDSQVSGYMMAEHLSGRRVAGCVYDVLRKPTHRPKRADKKALDTDAWTYYDTEMTREDIDEHQETGIETNRMFCLRLIAMVDEFPDLWFQRRVTTRTPDEVASYARDLEHQVDDIETAVRMGRLYKNTASCKDFNRPCPYLGVCKGEAVFAESSDWTKIGDSHVELDLPDGTDHSKVHTHSSITCFAACRRKWQYQYQQGWRKRKTEEPLYFGDLVHVGLEAWLKYQMANQREGVPTQ